MSEAPENGAAGIAIVGMAGRFPGAADIEQFWENLKAGVESVTFFSREELEAAGVEPRLLDDPGYVPARAVLESPDHFDAALFGFSPREAEVLDPQHRLLLECAWEALECAGYDPRRYDGLIGVYAGAGPNAYLLFNLIHNRDVLGAVGQFQAMLGNGGDFLATRLSYKLGLRGPSLTVQTACSTSLVAVHLAAQSLLNGECDMALAGGVRVSVPQRAGYLFQPDGILSPDGHCRPFDEDARGAIDGDGAGLVVLKRLDDALADGDRIHAVILGTAINNDGSGKVGYTAPGVDGQAGAVAMAQALAAVHPETVGLIEGHGTGTPLGDPVEVAALRQVFEAATSRRRFCALGSVKSNVGHLDAAAGVTSLIKAALALEREVIPPTLHFQRPNPRLGLEDSPFFVNAGPLPWPPNPEPRRAGVSSFGMGGTNAHVVLEEAPPVAPGDPSSHPAQVLVLSAASASALEEMTDRLAEWLERHPDLDLADVAFTLQVGRQVLAHRRALVCRDVDEAREALRSRRARSRVQEPESRPVAFLGDGESEAARRWREWGIVPDVVLGEGELDLATVLERPGAVLVDLGTGRLAERARRHPLCGTGHVVVSSGDMLGALAELWLAGVEVDWRGFHAGERRLRVALPAYPFERRRYWIEGDQPVAEPLSTHPSPGSPHPLTPSPAILSPLPGRGGNRAAAPRPPLSTPFVAPRTDLERHLATLFRELLGIDPVGAFDSFFEIGGHSLLGLQLISRMRSELGAEVPLEALFQAATVADLAELVGLIEAEGAGIPRVSRDRDLPLSFAQERLWFLDRLDPGTPAFNLNQAVRLAGALDVSALAAALAEVVRRHESLRTAFLDVQGRPAQRVLPAVDAPLPVVDLSGLSQEMGEIEAGRLATRAGDRRFDLARPPLLAAELYRLAPDRHAVALVLHHIVGDGWSIAVLLTELAETYRAFAAGEPSPLPGLEVQYPDFASWQRSRLGEAEIERQLAEWRAQLAPPLPVLDLPTDRPRPAVQTFRGAGELLTLPPDLAESLRALGRAQGATPFMALLSAFSLVLSRWSGQEDLIVGSPIAGRDRRELEPLIGIFLNMLPLRVDLSGGPGFRAVLGRVREVALAAYGRQDVPVERLIEEVQPRRDLSRSPLFQVLFNLQDFPRRAFDVPGLAIEALPVREVPSRFDLTVYGEEAEGGAISLELVYNADLFDAATIRQLLAQLRQAVAAAVEEPDASVSQLSLVTPEAAAVLPDPRAPLPAVWTGAVHERFAIQARRHPERPAVIDAAGTWTYGDLAARAGRLAGRLRAEGVGRGDLVAVYAHRSAPLVQALLGVLEAGAAFLILDPGHPPLRLRAALAQASPRAFLEIEAAGPVPETLAESIPSSALWLRLGDVGDATLGSGLEIGPEDLAYVAFTSGSTGEPKGILGSHDPLSHFRDWHSAQFNLTADDRFSLLSGLSHDPLLRDVFTPLGLGATLCIPEPDDLGSPVRLAGWMARRRVTVSHLTPALGQILADGGAALPDLRRVFFGGDILTEGDVARLRAKAPDAACVNFYGATETPQAVAWFDASASGDWPARRVPIGRGIEGVQLLVLNEAGELAAPGELGEVCVRTPYLALGYLNGERFLGDTYRTGDLGRYRPDGAVVLAGRRDDQVQVRGFRVEPAEVEAALALHPTVRDAAVLLRGQVLTAWLVAAGPLPSTGELRDFLRQHLPDPMVPEAFVWLDRLPLTPNGKLDRRALPDPEPDRETGAEAPATPVEDGLAALWCELLGLDRIGRHDNFFALGGHSLLATRLVARVHETFGVDLPLRHLFEAPTIAGLAQRIAGEEGRRTVGAVQATTTAPVSFSQRRLWFLDRLEPGSAAYNLPFAVRLLGPLDASALARAFTGIARRHEPLRTTFAEEGGKPFQVIGEPVQVIASPAPVLLPLADLAGLPPERRDPETLRIVADEAARPFDLARGPLFRPLLLRVAPDAHVVSATMHHVVTDGWSTGILLRELGALYTGLPLPELRTRYADFAAWQRRWLEGPEPAGHIDYWKRRLEGAPVLELPTDRPRPAVRRGRGATEPVAFSPDLVLPLERLARGERATLYMALLAAFQVLLYRYTDQEDLVVGSPVAGRERPEVQDLIGFFVNALALRSQLRDDEPFRAFLGRVRDVCLEAYAHQELPFDKLVEEIQPQRSLARAPVFQVVLSLEERPREARLPDLRIEPVSVHTGASKFDLNLLLAARDGRLDGFVEYDADLFEPDTVRRLIGHFGNLLAAAVADPAQRIAELPLMGEAELRQTLTPLAPLSRHPFPPPRERGETLPDLFAAQAARRPDAVALSLEGEALTYGELARRAGHVARQLRGLGVGPEVSVALWCERDLGLPVAVLGVLAAGGAYVPVDPAWPAERVAFVLEDSGSRLLLRAPGTARPPASSSVQVIELNGVAGDEPFPAGAAAPDHAAYVIYTSGSTGRPKGVAVTHRNVARLLAAAQPWFGFGERDVWTLFHSYAFDFSVWEIWGALAHGGRLVVVPFWAGRSPEALAEVLEREGVTVLNQTPSAFYALLDVERRTGRVAGPALSWVVFGGEALDAGRLAPWWERHGADRPRLANMYGITETTVHVTFRPVLPEDAWSGAGSAIGQAIPDLSVHVLGPGLMPVPLGVPGELYVGGAGLARGYLGRPALTAERFVPDPFAQEPGARLYRTGDLGRRASGELEYLGRVDRQVKVRGFRIEPGEIEAALVRHPAVAEAAVVVRDDLPGGRGLAAFWVPAGTEPAGTHELRAFLKEHLPEALVPTAFVRLDRLPVTANGKVDRRALAALRIATAGHAGEPSFTAPRTPAEELLAGLWTELLGCDRVAADDDFFDLGGHSLLATQLVSRVRETLGVELPLRAVFQAPTLAAMAAALSRTGEEDAAPPLVPVDREGDLPLSFAQQRLWFLDRLVPGNPFFVMAFGLRLEGRLDVGALRRAVREVVRRQGSLRTTFHTVDGEPRQRVAEPLDVALPVIDLSGRETELREIGQAEARRPFDLQRGPLLRGLLVHLGTEDHVLLLHLHHIIADGWSMGVLRRELSVLYDAFAAGRPSPLPELPVQYADFAVWQRRWLSGETLERQLGYWRRQLAGVPPVLELPLDRPRPAVETFRGSVSGFALEPGLVERLRALGRSLGCTLSMTALAAYDLLLARYTRRDDVVVGSAVANRNRRETEELIGFFVNVLVLRADLSGDPTFAALAGRVREMSLDAYAHQDLPFEKLVEELQLPRDLAHHPLCQAMYGFQNFPRHELRVGGLTLTPLEGEALDTGTAKADVTLFLAETDDTLQGWIEFNGDLFEEATIRRMQRHLAGLLEAAAADPGRPIAALPMLAEAERHQLLREWSGDAPAGVAPPLLAVRFLERVGEAPDAAALVWGEGTVSYGGLQRRAARLARQLRALGVAPEVRVGLRLGRPEAMVEGILGVLLAGGAWVPLDPEYPPARLDLLLGDAGCQVLLTEEDLLLPEDGEDLDPPALLPANLAYVIYTSGSTGRPKGVAVTQGGLARVTDSLVRDYGVGRGDHVLQMMSPSFDVYVSELAMSLGSGATLHLAERDERMPGPPLAALLRERGITVINLMPSLMAAMAPSDAATVRTLITGGETCPPELAARWAPGRRILIAYGPTETTITCTVGRYEPGGPPPVLGRPLAGARIHLLEGWLEPVPAGVPGELCVAGEGVSRGYLHRPDRTAELFLPDPFGPAGSRLYRTGDLARRLPDGNLEFLGRIDEQVKLRGFRVEPGEVEARLAGHPEVATAVVVARGQGLVGYVVPRHGGPEGQDEHLESWQGLYEELYGRETREVDPSFDISGWNSSFTGEPIPHEEMREWVEATVEEILALRPDRVLEIGCGSGLLLQRIAPRCSFYVGTDLSAAVLAGLGRRVKHLPQVRLEHRPAHDFAGLPERAFDTVVLNSVVQYFPGGDYLVEVLEKAVAAVADGGSIFLGDVRSLPLAEAFHLAVELHGADPSLPVETLRGRAAVHRLQEAELLVAPALFHDLRRRLDRIGGVEVRPKRGRADNELTGFRYQVVLRVGEAAPAADPETWLDWDREGLTLAGLARRLREERPDVLAVERIPNARVAPAVAALRLLSSGEVATAGELREAVRRLAPSGVHPDDLRELAAGMGYEVDLSWEDQEGEGRFTAVLSHLPLSRGGGEGWRERGTEGVRAGAAGAYTNDPLLGRLARRLVPELRAWAQETLPDFLVPSAFVVLESLPRTPSGKIDRRALPAPEMAGTVPGEEVAPRTPVEIEVAAVFRDLLGRERLGAETDFFAAGGHSLLATQAVSRLRERFGVELALRGLFETPTVAGQARRIEAALAEHWMLEGALEAPPVRPVPRDVPPPLSFAQERLWFLDQLDAGRSPWSLFSGLRFLGRLDLPALAAALDGLARRHESLRTTFAVEGGRPVQVIAPEPRVGLPLVDLSGLPGEARGAETTRWIDREAQRPFDLMAGPLIRALALRLGPEEHAVALVLHHIVSDGWSMGVLNQDLAGLYGAFAAGHPSPLAPLPVQYADFAVWQRSWLQGEALERQLGYWRERLAGAPPVLALPLDRPRPAVRAFHGRRRAGELPAGTVAALSSLARRSGATLFMTLLAAWQALLFRVTGEPDLVVGTPVANRDRVELEGLIGLFVNTLAMRTDLAGAPGFLALLERVRETALGAYAHQDLPFERLVEELAPERDLRQTPVFQAFFAFEEEPPAPPEVPGLALRPLAAENRSVKFDLTLLARRLAGGMELVVAYNSDLFHATTAERLLGHLRTLIESAVADPGRPVGELPLLSEAQRHQLLPGWNDTAREIEPLPLHKIFEAQAALRADRAALVAAGESLTYGEVDRRAGRLARLLAREGVGPEARVALCLGRSPGLVTSILAVLKAGGAWVPLDPDLPRERLAFLLEDSGAALLITEERLLANLPETGIPVLVLDLERDALEREDGPAPAPELSPDALAYVIYTSGSTGAPKGVAVTHRGLASLARAQVEVFGLEAGDRILQFASPAFDASVSEMAIAWQAGAELHLADPGGLLPGASLTALLRERGITNVTLPPTALAVTPPEELPRLRSLVVAGEPCPPELAERWSAGRRFTNAYGPTETTVCATAGPYEPGSLRMTLGRPVANARVHLLDPAGVEPVAIGVAGELCVAGPGLARGYLGRPDLTAGLFVPDPWGAPGERLYRTGDLARWLGDGRIELLGRVDEQVKVRGFRVEPGEVRTALLAHPAVREAEVLAPADVQSGRGERRLVAWVAADAGTAELREYLESRLPDWLVPSRFVFLDTLPKTASGKVDRRALPLPDDGEGRVVEGRREPADELERFLLEIWREVLGLHAIGVEEDFFALGGTSLQAAILTNLLQERLGDYVYAVALFDAPTIAELARYLERHYPAAAARIRGEQPIPEEEAGARVDAGMVAEIRRLIGSRPRPRTRATAVKSPRAVFVLSPPRSGSTLLRVLLAGNRRLFAPPELELLGFDTLGERARELSGRFGLWREGVVRAVMEARGCGFEEADALLAAMEAEDLPVAELYRRLQSWTAGRTLVDKTPSYALDRNVLERAEELFDEPLYIHLLRHPYATVASFEEAKLEQVFFRPRHSFARRQLAELIWQVSHRNILDFLETVPAGRQLRVRFEDLVRRPRAEMERASAFLGVPFEEGMLDPYSQRERKMTDGVHALSRMLGDVKFHTHSRVDPEVADRWKTVYRRDFLGDDTWELARELGYEERAGAPRHESLVKLRAGGTEPPLFLIHPLGGSAASYRELAARLDADRPVYGLPALGLGAGEEPQESIEEMASCYLEQVRRVAPEGPYHLGGWSLGGVIAFEMARQLVQAGERVDLLALFDAVVPGELPNERYDAVAVLRGLAWELGNLTGMDLEVSPEELRGLDGEEGVRYLLQRAHEAGALPPGFGVDQAVRTWRIIDANAEAFKRYKAQVYPGRAILFVAEKSRREGLGPDLGWNRVTAGGVERVPLDAHHSTVLRGAALEVIVERLKAYLVEERVGAKPGG